MKILEASHRYSLDSLDGSHLGCDCKKEKRMLKSFITDEQLVDICLNNVLFYKDGLSGPPGVIITAKALMLLAKETGKEEFSTDEIVHRVNSMLTNKVLENLSKEGLVDVHISDDVEFAITEKGREHLRKYQDDSIETNTLLKAKKIIEDHLGENQ